MPFVRHFHKNQTAGNFEFKNLNFKNDQNRKTENPNTPLLWVKKWFQFFYKDSLYDNIYGSS